MTTFIAKIESDLETATGLPMTPENADVFSGNDFRAATLAALADQGFTADDIPDAIAVHSGKAYITEHDGDRFWISILGDWLGEEFEWGYGATKEDALKHAFEFLEYIEE